MQAPQAARSRDFEKWEKLQVPAGIVVTFDRQIFRRDGREGWCGGHHVKEKTQTDETRRTYFLPITVVSLQRLLSLLVFGFRKWAQPNRNGSYALLNDSSNPFLALNLSTIRDIPMAATIETRKREMKNVRLPTLRLGREPQRSRFRDYCLPENGGPTHCSGGRTSESVGILSLRRTRRQGEIRRSRRSESGSESTARESRVSI